MMRAERRSQSVQAAVLARQARGDDCGFFADCNALQARRRGQRRSAAAAPAQTVQ